MTQGPERAGGAGGTQNPSTAPVLFGTNSKQIRHMTYLLLIVLVAGMVTGRILAVTAVDVNVVEKMRLRTAMKGHRKQLESQGLAGSDLKAAMDRYEVKKLKQLRLARPFLSANDRSRWCTIRALVDDGTYAIDQIVTDPSEHALSLIHI